MKTGETPSATGPRQRADVVKERSIPRHGGRRGQETPIPLPHEACFIEVEFDGIGRWTQRRVTRRGGLYPTLSFAGAADKEGTGRRG